MNSNTTQTLMSAEDHTEVSLLRRRIEFLELKSNPVQWKYRRQEIEEAYSDVKDGIAHRLQG